MPADRARIIPARTISWCDGIAASEGVSLTVGMNTLLSRMQWGSVVKAVTKYTKASRANQDDTPESLDAENT